jgi:hypothetical protein
MWDHRDLKNTMSPGSTDGWGNDNIVQVPADVRYYIVDSDPGWAPDRGPRPRLGR